MFYARLIDKYPLIKVVNNIKALIQWSILRSKRVKAFFVKKIKKIWKLFPAGSNGEPATLLWLARQNKNKRRC